MQDLHLDYPLTVAVAGATGYAGGEALRILAAHPNFEVTCVAGHSSAGKRLGEFTPHIPQLSSLTIEDTTPEVLSGHDVVILALPHGASGALAAQLEDVRIVIDLGADHRLESAEAWQDFYGDGYCAPWTYALPELITGGDENFGFSYQRSHLSSAHRLAGPGCNVTAVTLAFQPALAAGLVNSQISAHAVVGYSGVGRKTGRVNLLASEALGNATAYSVAGSHRHIPEIQQNFAHAQGLDGQNYSAIQQYKLGFTPVLAPMSRGIMATVSAALSNKALEMSDEEIRSVYEKAYGNEFFIELLPPTVLPATADVIGSNAAHIQVAVDRRAGLLYGFSAIDNLNRGTAGQAIQSLNIALGLPEDAGLTKIGVAP